MVNYNLNEHFNKSGHFSKLLVGKKKTDNKDVIEIPNEVRESFCIKLAKRMANHVVKPIDNIIRFIVTKKFSFYISL